ncbi:hypothetical protein Avbf_18228, partial [Armadillidium vulgare]
MANPVLITVQIILYSAVLNTSLAILYYVSENLFASLIGYPSSGKSVTAQKLSQYFTEERQKKVTIVSENEILNQ